MRKAFALAVILCAFQSFAGTISSISPSSLQMRSGEYFVKIDGSGFSLGDVVFYDGNAGHFEVEVSSIDNYGSVQAWIPLPVVNTPGVHTLSVHNRFGQSNTVNLDVLKPGRVPLQLHLPELLIAAARTRFGAGIKYEVNTTGGDPGTVSVKCDPESGANFPFGTSLIKCFATDGDGGRDEGVISVTVSDQDNPILKVPQSFEAKAELKEGAYIRYEVSAYDEIDGELKPVCSRESGSLFPNGRTIVNCETADASLNPAYGSFEVFVQPIDKGYLELRVPDDFKVAAEDKTGANVNFEVIAYGSADPDPVVTCSPESGTWFGMGATKVYCTAVDDFDQRAEGGFVVEVVDELGFQMDDVTSEATGPSGAEVTFATKVENWDAEFTCSPGPGSMFELGVTAVECESMDGLRKAVATFNVTVQDTVAPHITRADAVAGAYDATLKTTPVSVSVEAVDTADLAPQCSVASLTGEAGDVKWTAKSNLGFDVAGFGALRVQVSCVDASGNRATATVPVSIGGVGRRRDNIQ